MKMNPLGRTGIEVSELCLGTMTYGNQTPPEDAFAQMDLALERGVNFFDTAEMYPVNPVRAETVGRSEEIIGEWFARSGRRDEVILATKIVGEGSSQVRDGADISSANIPVAVEASLKRLRCDHIDLYQFHWPNRGSYMFRQHWTYDPSGQDRAATMQHMEDALGALQREVERGTIRAFGLSNESCWGTTRWIDMAERTGGPRVASVQNEYSLLCRLYDTDMAEMTANEDAGLMAFSPMAAGLLTGKYREGRVPEGSRMSLVPELGGRKTERAMEAAAAYVALAEAHGLDPAHMALAFVTGRPFTTSAIFGATTLDQCRHALDGAGLQLSDEVMEGIDRLHRQHAMPN
ncbi:aldo/keto reductase [Aquicoccus sp. SCR17]|nr:aldo/keto reductase [Carideicomes alvinocaridis]